MKERVALLHKSQYHGWHEGSLCLVWSGLADSIAKELRGRPVAFPES